MITSANLIEIGSVFLRSERKIDSTDRSRERQKNGRTEATTDKEKILMPLVQHKLQRHKNGDNRKGI